MKVYQPTVVYSYSGGTEWNYTAGKLYDSADKAEEACKVLVDKIKANGGIINRSDVLPIDVL